MSRSRSRFLFLLALASLVACRTVTDCTQPASSVEALLLVEHRRLEALLRSDVSALEPLYHADFVAVGRGPTTTRSEYFAALRTRETRFETLDHTNVEARIYGNLGIINGRARGRGKLRGSPIDRTTNFTHVYVHTQSGWQLLEMHNTEIAP